MNQCKPIMKSRRLLTQFLAAISFLPKVVRASDYQHIPLVVKWDIQPANSHIELDIEITKYMNYYIYVDFGRYRGPSFDMNELRKFIGDSGYQIVTKEPMPKVVNAQTTEEVQARDKLVRQGVYQIRLTNPGVVMPVQVKVEKLNDDLPATVLLDQVINTDRENFGVDRAITVVALKPGKYHIKLVKYKEITLPQGVTSTLVIAPHPNANVLKD